MKIKLILLIICVTISQFLLAQTQSQMNNDSYKSYKKTDDELGAVYQKILIKYKNNTEFINALRASERLWIQLRDAEIKMRFPSNNARLEYGSIYPMCVNMFLENITKDRIKYLREWLNKSEEGDVCSGSVGTY